MEEEKISPKTVSGLRLKWEFFAGKDITATPAIADGVLYFPSWNGNLYAVEAESGCLVWMKNLTELTGINGIRFIANVNVTVSRSTPTLDSMGLPLSLLSNEPRGALFGLLGSTNMLPG